MLFSANFYYYPCCVLSIKNRGILYAFHCVVGFKRWKFVFLEKIFLLIQLILTFPLRNLLLVFRTFYWTDRYQLVGGEKFDRIKLKTEGKKEVQIRWEKKKEIKEKKWQQLDENSGKLMVLMIMMVIINLFILLLFISEVYY